MIKYSAVSEKYWKIHNYDRINAYYSRNSLYNAKSIVGPSSSFMYQNPEWTINGYVIIAIGTIISVFGIVIWQSGTKKSSIAE